MNIDGLLIGLSLFSILFIFLSLVAGKISYHGRFKKTYSLRNCFPYEFNYQSKFMDNFYGNISIIISFTTAIIFYSFLINKVQEDGVLLALSIFGLFASIGVGLLYFLPLGFIKAHLSSDALFFVSNLVMSGLIMIGGYKLKQEGGDFYFLIFFYVGIVLTIFNFALVFNPKLSFRFNPVEKIDEKGNKTYEKPKYIVLAFSEWLAIFSFYINLLTILILAINL